MLLQFLSSPIVGCGDAELQSLPADWEAYVVGIHVLASGQVKGICGWFLLGLVFCGRAARGRRLPRYGDDLDGVSFKRFGSGYGELLAKDGNLVALVGHEILQTSWECDGACDLEEVPPVARQFRGWGLDIASGCPGRLGEEEHAVQLCGHGYGDSLHVVAEDGVGDCGEGEAEQLVVALDAGAFGHAVLVVWVDGLLIAALDVGEGVIVGAGEALERGRGLL